MKNPKYHLYLTPDERRTVINSLIDLRNDLISRGRYTDIIDELLVKFTKAKVKKIKVKSICMKKSLIEINRPETMRFLSYAELADHLEMVRDATEWKKVRSEETLFDGESGTNTFIAMGGDEFSCVNVSFYESKNAIPLRYTALNSILNRCEVSGDGIKKLFLADKERFAEHLNRYLSLKESSKRQMLALVQDGKLSALHSSAYTSIEQTEVFALVEAYLNEFDDVQFLSAEWSWEQTQASYEIQDSAMTAVYRRLLQKHFPGKNHCAVRLRANSSDVAEAAVRFHTYLLVGRMELPLTGSVSVKHIGKVSMDTVESKLKNAFSSFEASCRSLAGMADIAVRFKKNAMIRIFTDLHIPQKYAAEICEQYHCQSEQKINISTFPHQNFRKPQKKCGIEEIKILIKYEICSLSSTPSAVA